MFTAGFDSPWGHQFSDNALQKTVAGSVARTVLFSPEDSDLAALRWQINRWGYPVRTSKIDGKTICQYAHLLVMERILGRKTKPPGELVDHRFGNKLDARREKLRTVTPKQNAQARARGPFSGTTRHHRGKWNAAIYHNGERIHIGLFTDRGDAARAAAAKRKELGFLERDGGGS